MDVTHIRVDPSVTVLSEGVFEDRGKLEVVELPEGLISIEDCVFYCCSSLMRINIPSTVTSIGERVFEYCGKLELAVLPEGLQRFGARAFYHCNSLQSINIPPHIETIQDSTFLHCWGLTDITFSEGINEIGEDAFSRCNSLVSVTLPSSLKSIGVESFEGCKVLNKVHIPETIESIGAKAFKKCNFTNFRIPPSIDTVDMSIVGGSTCLVSLELPENVAHIKFGKETNSLRNIALPSQYTEGPGHTHTMWIHHKDLKVALLGTDDDDNDNDDTITDALKQRFDDLPIHKLCYYQSYQDTETTMQSLRREINPWTSKPPGQLNTSGKEQDCLGMTPLHILACSIKQNVEIYQLLIEKYPETLIMKDKWGDVPLLYAIWCNATSEVLDLLVNSYKSLHIEYEFEWKGMLLSLTKRNVPLANIEKLVNTQQSNFPDQQYDLQGLVMELAIHDTSQANLYKSCTSIDTFEYLLRLSIAKRLDSLAVRRWREELEHSMNALLKVTRFRDRDTQAVYDRLATFESIKEGTSVLELALWKHKMDESTLSSNAKSTGQSNKRARVDTNISDGRQQYRINCGANVVVRNVLPYLLPE